MKRPCFALTLLLASLAGSLLAIDSARSQSICHDEDARWQAHQAEEADYGYRSDYDSGYDNEVYRAAESTDVIQATPETGSTTEELDSYSLQNGIPEVSEEVDSYSAQQETGPQVQDIDSYWTQDTNIATEEVDPYWTQDNNSLQEETDRSADAVTSSEEDGSWNETKNDASQATEEEFFENPSPGETAHVDPQWAKDAVESVEAWIEKLNPLHDSEAAVEPQVETNIESPAQEHVETPVDASAEQAPVAEDVATEKPADNADPTYGAHLWDDCDLGTKAHWNCDRGMPVASNYGDESATSQDHASTLVEHRTLLLLMARSLNDAGLALQTASQSIARFAEEGVAEASSATDGIDQYRD